jgi:hypothetical protein
VFVARVNGIDVPEPWSTVALVVAVAGALVATARTFSPLGGSESPPVTVPTRLADRPRVAATRLARRLIRKRGGAIWIWADASGLTRTTFRPPLLAVEFEDEPLADGLVAHVAVGLVWPGRPVHLEYWAIPPRVVATFDSFRRMS